MVNVNFQLVFSWVNFLIEYGFWMWVDGLMEFEYLLGYNGLYKCKVLFDYGDGFGVMFEVESLIYWDLCVWGDCLFFLLGVCIYYLNFLRLCVLLKFCFYGGCVFVVVWLELWLLLWCLVYVFVVLVILLFCFVWIF